MRRSTDSLMVRMICIQSALLAVLLGIYLFTMQYSEHIVRQNTVELNAVVMEQVQGRIREYRDMLYNTASIFCQSPAVLRYFSGDEMGRVGETEDMAASFSNVLLQESRILSVSLYDTGMEEIANLGGAFRISYTQRYMRAKMQVETGYPETLSGSKDLYTEIFYPVYDLYSSQYRKPLGMCVFVAEPDLFAETLKDAQVTEHNAVFLLDQEGRTVASAGRSEDTVSYDWIREHSEDYYVQDMQMPLEGFRLISAIPKGDFQPDSALSRLPGVIFAAAVCLLLLQIFYYYARLIRPLVQIDGFIRRSPSAPAARLRLRRGDEVGNVAHSLDQMLDDIQAMQARVQEAQQKMYETQLARQQAELAAYRSQINPHFLYNTFACICEMAVCYDVEDIAELTRALSNVFRFAVKGGNMVTIKEELTYIEEYAKIIYYRFCGKMRVEIEADESLLQKRILKLLLQPLVENAVFHGLEQKRGGGTVGVRVTKRKGAGLCFVVEDDGCGMTQEQLCKLRQSLEQKNPEQGIGVSNIYRRLKLSYGEAFDFRIESGPGVGTCITIEILDREDGEE